MVFAETIGINIRSAEKMILKIVKLEEKYIEMCRASYMPEGMRDDLEKLIHKRIDILK